MKRTLLVCLTAVLAFAFSESRAQERTVTGKVTAAEDGSGLPGVNVVVKGTTNGTVTDADGSYTLDVPTSGQYLVFTFIGLKSEEIEIGGRTVIDIGLSLDVTQLSEIVVTALGEKREKKALGYSVQEVKGEKLTFAKSLDVNSSLAGKIAGVQLTGSPSSSFDNANIVIRGINTLNPTVSGATSTPGTTSPGLTTFGGGSSNPLYIVDGTPSDPQNVIMDNVESISVLKGASATALYGNRAANGVVVITTKRGTRSNKPKIELNLGVAFENLYIMPEYQDKYAGGYSSSYNSINSLGAGYLDAEGFYIFNYDPSIHPAEWASFQGQRMLEYGADESWGPKMNGQQYRPYYSWYAGDDFGQTTALTPRPDNIKNFYETGINLNNTISISGGGDKTDYRVTYANQHRTLTTPNASRDQNQVGITGSHDISKKLRISTDVIFTHTYTKGKPVEAYRNDGLNVAQNFNQWFQRQLDLDRLKDYRTPEGALMSWNIGDPNGSGDLEAIQTPQYWDSPYFVVRENYSTEDRNRLSGNLGLNYQINDIFGISGYARLNSTTANGDFRIATGGLQQDDYSLYQLFDREENYELNFNFKKTFGDISLDGFVGSNIRKNEGQYLYNSTEGGLSSPNYFDIAASIARPTTSRTINQKEVRSIYGKVSLGYKGFLFLDGTLRNDWSSTLPADNNSYLYPSVSGSFVFSELMNASPTSVFSFGKIRASYAQVGSDLGFNQVNTALDNGSLYDGNPSVTIGNQYRTGEVKPALTKSWEVGAEFKFFNRIGLDFAYYEDNNINQILSLDVSSTSGYSSAQVNAGNIQRKGWELSVSGTPFKSDDFSWDVTLNVAHNRSYVKELADGLSTFTYATSGDIRVEANVGDDWGNIYGRKWNRNADGLPIFSSTNGTIGYSTNNLIGNIQPNLTGGLYTTLNYKNFDLSFSFDFQEGGLFYGLTKYYGVGAGLSKYTTGENDLGNDIRDFPAAGGGVRLDGVYGASETPTTVYVPARRYYYTNLQRESSNYILDASYLKLREVRFGYTIPSSITSKLGISRANFGFLINNAWLIAAPAKKWGIDPSEIENYWYEGGQLSSSRTTGFNLKLTF